MRAAFITIEISQLVTSKGMNFAPEHAQSRHSGARRRG